MYEGSGPPHVTGKHLPAASRPAGRQAKLRTAHLTLSRLPAAAHTPTHRATPDRPTAPRHQPTATPRHRPTPPPRPPHRLLPPAPGGNACFNEQFLRIQGVWDQIAQTRPWLTNTTILGATQVAAGDAKASTGADRHIDMEKMGPAKYWPDYEACFHPGVFGGDKSGAMVVMEEFYREFWSSELGC